MNATDQTQPGQRPSPYQRAARYYHARPPYSAELRPALAKRLKWNGTGRLLDVGCGSGVLAFELAPSFAEIVGLDPEEAMLNEARRQTPPGGVEKFRWVRARAEELPSLNLATFTAATLGQSWHWTDKEQSAAAIYDCLKPGGSMLLIHHVGPAFGEYEPLPFDSPHPPVPHILINDTLARWLGKRKAEPDPNREPYSAILTRTRFGKPDCLVLPGRTHLVRTPDNIIDNYLSTSFAAPDLFGDRLADFRAELHSVLSKQTPTGFFAEWPGDTEVLIATKASD